MKGNCHANEQLATYSPNSHNDAMSNPLFRFIFLFEENKW
jgi:hypothetical protein